MDFRDSKSPSISVSASPAPPVPPTNDDIEAIIKMATSSRSSPDGRAGPAKDTRTQLFVGNLPYRVRWQDLKDLFRKAGTVLRADVSLGPDNRSRGYGTVLLATAEDAGRAIDMFNGYSWQTRILEVRPDRLPPDLDLLNPNPTPFSTVSSPGLYSSPQANSLLGGLNEIDYTSLYGLDRPSSSSGSPGRNLFVGNLPFHCQWQDLKDLFRQAGTIIRADVALGQDGRSRGFGTVVFATELDAEHAVKMFNGYEYNGRVLKVHYDKFSQSTQPMTTPASPALGSFQHSMAASPFLSGDKAARPNHIIMPSGYTLDFGPASAPGTPYDVYPQLQMSMPHPHHTHSHIHQPIPSRELERPPQAPSLESLTSAFKLSRVSDSSSHSGSSSESIKPSTSAATSASSRTSPSSEHSAPKSPASNQSYSPPKPPFQPPSHHHSHPHHPGTISIPPASFSIPVHNMSPLGIPMSPYYPGMSPLHHPAHVVPMTPHGLPPITPSMPPFTFLPPYPLPSPHTEGIPDMSMNGRMTEILTPTYTYPPPTSSAAEGSQDEKEKSEDGSGNKEPSTSNSSSTSQDNASASPALAASQSSSAAAATSGSSSSINPYFQPPAAQAHLPAFPLAHHQLTPFSPGLAMSPGAFWGRPGAGPNPFINPAVGAPVHVVQGSPGGFFYHPHPSPGMPGSVGAEMGSRGGAEPGGYFDSVTMGQGYFPPVQYIGGMSTSNVEGEILKDKAEKEEDREKEKEGNREKEEKVDVGQLEFGRRERVFSGPTSPMSHGSGSSMEAAVESTEFTPSPFALGPGPVKKEGFMARAHSMSSQAQERPQLHRPESDPAPVTMKTLQEEDVEQP